MILLTGATGYIGTHIWIELLGGSKSVIGLDNLSNSSIDCLDAIAKISGVSPNFIQGDIRDMDILDHIFSEYQIKEVIHLAALKDIQESMSMQTEYLDVNVHGLNQLLKAMRKHECHKIIFSSSAAVYGTEAKSPILESANLAPLNFYGETKLQDEKMLENEFNKSPPINSISLRYFNVAGKHKSGLLDEYEFSKSHSLFSEIEKIAKGESERLSIFGDDWDTPDGTCIRDYLHVADLARGHIQALNVLSEAEGCFVLNLGLGVGKSVYEVISTYEQVSGKSIPKVVAPRRMGDVPICFADTNLASTLIGWSPVNTLSDICRDSYQSCRMKVF